MAGKKILSIAMSLALVMGLCPGLAFAAVGEGGATLVAGAASDSLGLGAQAAITAQAASSSATSAINQLKKQTYYIPGGKCPSGKNVGWLIAGSTNCANECYAFAAGVCDKLFGAHPGGVMSTGYTCTSPGMFVALGAYKNPSLNTVKELMQKGYPGDWLQFCSGGAWGGAQHSAILEAVDSNGVRIYQHGNSSHVTSTYYTWSQFYNSYLAMGSKNYRGYSGVGLYHYKDYEKRYAPDNKTVKKPTISATDVPGGKKVDIKNSESGASIRYTTDGKTDPSNTTGTVYGGAFYDTWTTMGVRAIAYKSGYVNSTVTGKTFSNKTTGQPVLTKVDLANGSAITLDSAGTGETIYYTIDGSNPSFNVSTGKAVGTKYTGAFNLSKNTTVKAIAVRSGELVSGMLTQSVEVTPPAVPENVATYTSSRAAAKIAVDDAVTVRWDVVPSASSYVATLYDASGNAVETTTVKAAQAVFTPSKAGTYSVGVKASNSIGASDESERVEFQAMAPCIVNFVDKSDDGKGDVTTTILDKQLVRYGYSAETPAVPSKRGYTFAGWDRDTPLTNITEDGYEIVATWQIKTYTLRFYKDDGKSLIGSQSVEYGSAATPPTPPAPESGYVFSGWAVTEATEADSERDYTKVDSNMSLKAVYAWADKELPVVVSVNSAKRNDRVYTVDVNVKNNPMEATTAILRVSLKTSAGKLVQSARETISLPAAGATKSHVVTLKYEDGGYIATQAEVEVVGFSGDNRTGGAYSKAVTATVVSADNYSLATSASEWSTTKPSENEDYVIESEKQYRYQDKQTTTSTSSSLSGWTRTGDPVTTYGAWSATKTTTSKPAASDTLKITATSTKYNYFHYCNKDSSAVGGWSQDSVKYGSSNLYHTLTTTSKLGAKYIADRGGRKDSCTGSKCSYGYTTWWLGSTTTTYSYQTRSKTVTYSYYKWGDWSGWSNTAVSSSGNRNVEERTVYRTRAKIYNNLDGTEDVSGESHTIKGSFGSDLDVAGKEATIMVYNVTNSDPNEDQIQYIGQTVIGSDGSYEFSFIPKKQPSAETGDFIVSLGVKGSTGLVNVDKIDAPGEEHTVIYLYKNAEGEEVKVSEQQVADGQSATVPDPPAMEGSQFQRWSASTTNVTTDMTVSALYTTATYAVAWVDWVNGGVFLETKAYGDTLAAPVEDPVADGYTFKGWDALLDGKTTVTGNTVVNAVYDPLKYTVIFANAKGGVFAKQEVAYGEAAELPEGGPETDGMEFVAWDTSAGTPWWNVTEDMIVTPKFAYEGTVSSPFSTVELAEGYVSAKGTKVFLESATPGSRIYYTVDGSVPAENTLLSMQSADAPLLRTQAADELPAPLNTSRLYDEDEGITITEPTTIRAIAVQEGMNDSSIAEIEVDATATNDVSNAEAGISEAPFYYGDPVEPGVMVWLGEDLLTYGEDYEVEYAKNNALGTATATVKGIGAYTGTQVVSFDIVEPLEEDETGDGSETNPGGQDPNDTGGSGNANSGQGSKIDISTAKVDGIVEKAFTGKAIVQAPKVIVGGKTLKAGTDYTVSYQDNVNVGVAIVSIVGKGAYTGSKAATFKIKKAKNTLAAKAKAKTLAVKFAKLKKKSQAISKAKAFTVGGAKGAVTFAKKSGNGKIVVSKAGKLTVKKGLLKGTYTVKVNVKAAGNANYSPLTKVVTLKVKVK